MLKDVRALCVDGNPLQRLLIAELMSEWGMRVDGAASAEQAISMMLRVTGTGNPYRVVLIDQDISRLSPIKLGEALTAKAGGAPLDLVLLAATGRSLTKDGSAAVFSAVLPRPMRASTLGAALVRVIQAPPGAAALATPSAELADATSSRAANGRPDGATKRLVLLVDDNAANQRVAVRMLERLGCRVDTAANGREAIDLWARVPYEIIFMDCQMPEMDGYEATAERVTRIPIVALTANAMQGDRDRCLEAGMDDYLSKPIKPEGLKAILGRWSGTPSTA